MNRTTSLFLFLLLTSACGDDDVQMDVGSSDAGDDSTGDLGQPDMGQPDMRQSDTSAPSLMATESNEADILYGWVAAGQPTEARLTEVVATGAVIISLRHVEEEMFDEQALIEGLGGTFVRYPTSGEDYDNMAFREAMYDLYDGYVDSETIVYLHCASSNRVGASWALYQAQRKGVAPEEALIMGQAAGLSSLTSRVRSLLGL